MISYRTEHPISDASKLNIKLTPVSNNIIVKKKACCIGWCSKEGWTQSNAKDVSSRQISLS